MYQNKLHKNNIYGFYKPCCIQLPSVFFGLCEQLNQPCPSNFLNFPYLKTYPVLVSITYFFNLFGVNKRWRISYTMPMLRSVTSDSQVMDRTEQCSDSLASYCCFTNVIKQIIQTQMNRKWFRVLSCSWVNVITEQYEFKPGFDFFACDFLYLHQEAFPLYE